MDTAPAARVAIALGSNLGDRRRHLEFALQQLHAHLTDLCVSSVIETEPVDVPDPQPAFLNAVVAGETQLSPESLLEELMRIERARDRERPHHHAARTLDLDLILYGAAIIHTPTLQVPHPQFRERLFVLTPLAELVPGWIDPVTGLTVAQLR